METLLWLALAAAAAPPVDLASRWEAVAPIVAKHSALPVPLGADDIDELSRGEVVGRRYDTASGAYATGAVWIDAPIEAVWIAIHDGPHDAPSRVSFHRLPGAQPHQRQVYMLLDLPFPLSDRQWVADLRTNTALYEATGGVVWQRQWDLGDRALAPSPDAKAVWVDENRGSWTLLDLPEGTLALFSVRSVLGGAVPASIAQTWAVGTLKTALGKLVERAQGIGAHYDPSHERVITPAGQAIGSW
jgi:hypothetical protein